jgi:hypothetical protein
MTISSPAIKSPEIMASLQTLLVISMHDAITKQAPRTIPFVEVSLSSDSLGEGEPFEAKHKRIGTSMVALYGRAEDLLPQDLDDAETVSFTINIVANEYADTSISSDVLASELKVREESLANGLSLNLVNAPLFEQEIELSPLAVGLQGQIVQDNDPFEPASGATITITDPNTMDSTSSDTQGRFRFSALPVTQSIELSIEFNGTTTVFTHNVDFAKPLNQITLSVNG